MELFSLEEEECPELFITQESHDSSQDGINGENDGNYKFLGVDVMDFTTPVSPTLVQIVKMFSVQIVKMFPCIRIFLMMKFLKKTKQIHLGNFTIVL